MNRSFPLLCVSLLLMASAASAQKRYLAFGDSVTEGYGDDTLRAELGYPPRLQVLLREGLEPNAVVENHGLSGERTPEALLRVDSVLARGGSVFLIMEGTNDISGNISPETTRFNISEMARRARNRGFEVVHATTIPRWPWANRDSDNRLTTSLNKQVRDLAGSTSRPLVDPFEVFLSVPNVFGEEYLQDFNDPVGHPNAKGYDRIAQIFYDAIAGIDEVPPVLGVSSPDDGDFQVPRNTEVFFDLWDFGAGVDVGSVELSVDGIPVNATVRGGGRAVEVSWRPSSPLSGAVRVTLTAQDLANPPNRAEDRKVATFLIAGSRYLEGDINEDGRVDGSDLVRMGLAFGARTGDPRWYRTADANRDGIVDGEDLALLAGNFGKSGP